MEISNLITLENNTAISQVLVIAKQDAALENAIKALNNLSHINKIEFESYGKRFGISPELLAEINTLKNKLGEAKYGRF
jgi:hypothetical protein